MPGEYQERVTQRRQRVRDLAEIRFTEFIENDWLDDFSTTEKTQFMLRFAQKCIDYAEGEREY